MTDDASQKPTPGLLTELLPWFDAWKTCAQNVLSQISGQPHTFELHPEPVNAGASDLCYTVVAAGAVRGEMALRLPLASGIRLARKFLGEIATPAEASAAAAPGSGVADGEAISNDDREALEELLRQITGLAATAIGA